MAINENRAEEIYAVDGLVNAYREVRGDLHLIIRELKFKLFVTDFIYFLLEETQLSVIRGQYSPDVNEVIITLDMEREYSKFGTYHPRIESHYWPEVMDMISYICSEYGITMEQIEDYEYGFMVPINLVTEKRELDVETLKGITK